MTDRFHDIAKNLLSEGLDEHAKFDALKEKYGVTSLRQFSEQYLSTFVSEAVEATSEDFVRREMIREGVRSHIGDNLKGGRPEIKEEPIEEMKKGALHKDLGIPQDKPIPTSKIRAAKAKAEREGDKTEIKRTTFALNTREEKEIKEDDGEVDEEITSKTPAGSVIHDFVHSKNKMFKGDDKKERIKRALGAYYSMHEESCQCEECRYMKEEIHAEGHAANCKCSECKMLRREKMHESNKDYDRDRQRKMEAARKREEKHQYDDGETPSGERLHDYFKKKDVDEETEEHAHQNRARKAIRKVLTAKKALEDGDDDSKKKLEEVLVLKNTHTHGDKMAKIYWDRDWHEHRVKLFHGGVHQKEADYHTPDRDDAEGTAHVMIGKPHPDSPVNESVGRKTHSFSDWKNLAHDLASHITPDGKVDFHSREVGTPTTRWHQTSSVIHNMRLGKSYSYGVFNHKSPGSEEGHGHHLTPFELDEARKVAGICSDCGNVLPNHRATCNKGQREAKTEKKPINELSKKTLGNYVKQSSLDYGRKMDDRATLSYDNPTDAYGEPIQDIGAHHDKLGRQLHNRRAGIDKAVNRLTAEEPINELSKKTLASYVKKAHVSGTAAAADAEGAYQRMVKLNKDDPKGENKVAFSGHVRRMQAANKVGEKREQGINRAAKKLAREEIEGSLRDVVSDADKERKFGLTHAQYELSPHDALDDAGKLVPADKDPIADVTVQGVELRGVPRNPALKPALREASNHAPTLHYFQNEENAKPKGSFMEVTSTSLSEWAKRKGIYNKVTEATKKMTRKEDTADSSNAGKRDDNEEPLVRASQKGPDKINLKPTMPDGLTNPDGASPVRSGLSEKRKR